MLEQILCLGVNNEQGCWFCQNQRFLNFRARFSVFIWEEAIRYSFRCPHIKWAVMFYSVYCHIGERSFTLADYIFLNFFQWQKRAEIEAVCSLYFTSAGKFLENCWSSPAPHKMRRQFYNGVVLFCAAIQTSLQLTHRLVENQELECRWSESVLWTYLHTHPYPSRLIVLCTSADIRAAKLGCPPDEMQRLLEQA